MRLFAPLPRLTLAVVFALLYTAAPETAEAQVKLEASYTISLARIPIGSATTSADFGDAATP